MTKCEEWEEEEEWVSVHYGKNIQNKEYTYGIEQRKGIRRREESRRK